MTCVSPPQALGPLHWGQAVPGTRLHADCVFRVWGVIGAEGSVLVGWVRTLDLTPCRVARNHAGLFIHLAGVGGKAETWPRLRGTCLKPRALGVHMVWMATHLTGKTGGHVQAFW